MSRPCGQSESRSFTSAAACRPVSRLSQSSARVILCPHGRAGKTPIEFRHAVAEECYVTGQAGQGLHHSSLRKYARQETPAHHDGNL